MVVQHFNLRFTQDAADDSGDQIFGFTGNGNSQFLTNSGKINPEIRVASGEWVRTRIIYAGWDAGALDMTISRESGSGDCEMQLLAKDGIYISDFPRDINLAPPGGRADIMVRCSGREGSTYQITGLDMDMGIITIIGEVDSEPMRAWTPVLPYYLADLQDSVVPTGCSCPTRIGTCTCDGNCPDALQSDSNPFAAHRRRKRQQPGPPQDRCISGRPMEHDLEPLNLQKFNVLQERVLAGIDIHPYHQHTWSFQLIRGVAGDDDENSYNALKDSFLIFIENQTFLYFSFFENADHFEKNVDFSTLLALQNRRLAGCLFEY